MNQAQRTELDYLLKVGLPDYFNTPEGMRVKQSCADAIWRLGCKYYTGKEEATPTADDLFIGWAVGNLPEALENTDWKKYAINNPSFLSRLGKASVSKNQMDNADCMLLGGWTLKAGPGLPPLCFFTDQALSEWLVLCKQPTTFDATRKTRQRWNLQQASFKLIKDIGNKRNSLIVG